MKNSSSRSYSRQRDYDDDSRYNRRGRHDRHYDNYDDEHQEADHWERSRSHEGSIPRRELQSYRDTNPPSSTLILHGIPVSVTEESVRPHSVLDIETPFLLALF